MPRLAVVAYPDLEADDRAWIESVRALRDPQARLLPAHVTLAFPAELATADALRDVSSVANRSESITFTLRWARAVRDAFGTGGHVFLVPDEGFNQIAALHDDLYLGVFASSRRADISFIPHITIGANPDFGACENSAREMTPLTRLVHGCISKISLVEITAAAVETVEEFRLLSAARHGELNQP
jgi:2'-5' RNA ligase